MRLALSLARRGRGKTSPNPCVGALVVRAGLVVGRGWHRRAGGPHAEVFALDQAGRGARGATLYVNIEPCCHTAKRTPPCTGAIVRSGIARVVAGTIDPNPRVRGRGLARLRAAGVETAHGVLEEDCRALNEPYLKHARTGLPFVTLKLASSLDGRIAARSGRSRWITGEQARARVHRMRAAADAVMVGIGTVLADDPELTVRSGASSARGRAPARVVLDSRLRIPLGARILAPGAGEGAIVVTGPGAPDEKAVALAARGATVLRVPEGEGGLDLAAVLEALGRRGVQSLLVEGGSTLAAGLLKRGLVDMVAFFLAPILMGDAGAVPAVGDLGVDDPGAAPLVEGVRIRRVGADLLVEGRPRPPGGSAGRGRARGGATARATR